MSNYQPLTLNEVIIQEQSAFPYARGELSRLLIHIGIASKIVHREVNKAGLVDILGDAGDINIQGETQQKLDVFADEQFIAALKSSGICCGVASEENDNYIIFEDELSLNGKYVMCMDPLDGSSNIDVNVSVGTIFSIYRRISEVGKLAQEEDFLQAGTEQVAAGYIIYGSSTMMVYTTGLGTTGFTYDPSIGEFCLSHRSMKTPEDGKIYSINEGNYYKFPKGVKQYLKYAQESDRATNRPYSSRYIGSMVADIHRNLLYGGIFMYPADSRNPHGKLRLQYECNPMAFIVEQAGGACSTGRERIMEIDPSNLHQRVPVILGSKDEVERVISYHKEHDTDAAA